MSIGKSRRSRFSIFYSLYIIGLLVPASVALLKSVGAIKYSIFNDKSNWVIEWLSESFTFLGSNVVLDSFLGLMLLGWGGSFIIFLYISAIVYLRNPLNQSREDIFYFKEYIQVKGYLLTLIGFLIAILSLVELDSGGESTNLSSIAFPIGLALITSILGWGFGNELMNNFKSEDIINESLRKLKKNIDDLGGEILQTKLKYEDSTKNFIGSIVKLTAQQSIAITEFNKSQVQMIDINKDLQLTHNDSLVVIKQSLEELVKKYKGQVRSIGEETKNLFSDFKTVLADSLVILKSGIDDSSRSVSTASQRIVKMEQENLNALKLMETDVKEHIISVGKNSVHSITEIKGLVSGILNEMKTNLVGFNSEITSRKQIVRELHLVLEEIKTLLEAKIDENEK